MPPNIAFEADAVIRPWRFAGSATCSDWLGFCGIFKRMLQLDERLATCRLMADYEAGDMTIHRAYMIHAATTNQNPRGQMHLSTGIRCERRRDEIDRR